MIQLPSQTQSLALTPFLSLPLSLSISDLIHYSCNIVVALVVAITSTTTPSSTFGTRSIIGHQGTTTGRCSGRSTVLKTIRPLGWRSSTIWCRQKLLTAALPIRASTLDATLAILANLAISSFACDVRCRTNRSLGWGHTVHVLVTTLVTFASKWSPAVSVPVACAGRRQHTGLSTALQACLPCGIAALTLAQNQLAAKA